MKIISGNPNIDILGPNKINCVYLLAYKDEMGNENILSSANYLSPDEAETAIKKLFSKSDGYYVKKFSSCKNKCSK